jgi:hypothetical protein
MKTRGGALTGDDSTVSDALPWSPYTDSTPQDGGLEERPLMTWKKIFAVVTIAEYGCGPGVVKREARA